MRSSIDNPFEFSQSDGWFGHSQLLSSLRNFLKIKTNVYWVPTMCRHPAISITYEHEFNLHSNSVRSVVSSLHFTDEEVMAPKGYMAFPKSHWSIAKPSSELACLQSLYRQPHHFTAFLLYQKDLEKNKIGKKKKRFLTLANSTHLSVCPTGDELELFRVITNTLE